MLELPLDSETFAVTFRAGKLHGLTEQSCVFWGSHKLAAIRKELPSLADVTAEQLLVLAFCKKNWRLCNRLFGFFSMCVENALDDQVLEKSASALHGADVRLCRKRKDLALQQAMSEAAKGDKHAKGQDKRALASDLAAHRGAEPTTSQAEYDHADNELYLSSVRELFVDKVGDVSFAADASMHGGRDTMAFVGAEPEAQITFHGPPQDLYGNLGCISLVRCRASRTVLRCAKREQDFVR